MRKNTSNSGCERNVDAYENRKNIEGQRDPVLGPYGEKNKLSLKGDHGRKPKSDEETPLMMPHRETPGSVVPFVSTTVQITSQQQELEADVYTRKKSQRELRQARDNRHFRHQKKRILERMELNSSEGEADQSGDLTPPRRPSQTEKSNKKESETWNRMPDVTLTCQVEKANINSVERVDIDQKNELVEAKCNVENTGRKQSITSGSEKVTWGGSLGILFGEPD